jgi:hypothetical protein
VSIGRGNEAKKGNWHAVQMETRSGLKTVKRMQMLLSLNRSDAAISQCYDLDLQTFDVTVKLKATAKVEKPTSSRIR